MTQTGITVDKVLTDQLGVAVGVICLDRPEALNALNSEMIALVKAQLMAWAEDENIELVLIRGRGERAFCAGGDVKALYDEGNTLFLAEEYRLDFALYFYPKPLVFFLHGFVFGGGLGLAGARRLSLCTLNTEFAMPETAIGFFPDVGYRFHLARMPYGFGAFMGLTGARIRAPLAQALRIVDYVLPSVKTTLMLSQLFDRIAQWSRKEGDLIEWIATWAFKLGGPNEFMTETGEQPKAITEMPQDVLKWCEDYWAFSDVDWRADLESLTQHHFQNKNELFVLSQSGLGLLSPLSLTVTDILLRRAKQQTLQRIFEEDYWAATKIYENGDLREGILAKVIERRAPEWLWTWDKMTDDIKAEYTPPQTIANVLGRSIKGD